MKTTAAIVAILLIASTQSISLKYLKRIETNIYRVGSNVNCAIGKMAIDADGSPHAYHPKGSPPGLDYLGNAGKPGNWWGIVTNNRKSSGTPIVQGRSDPAPGFYVSATALVNSKVSWKSPNAYANSETIPFIVVPGASSSLGWGLGDFATVCNSRKKACYHAIVADIGPRSKFGEASMKLASAIGLNNSPKRGGANSGIIYIVYNGSRSMRSTSIPSNSEIQKTGSSLYKKYGGDAIRSELRSNVAGSHPVISVE